MSVTTLGVFAAVVLVATPAAAQPDDELLRNKEEAKKLFLIVERVVRLPVSKQSAEIGWLYSVVAPRVVDRRYAIAWIPGRDVLFANGDDLSPESLADRILGTGGYAVLHEAARIRCLDLLRAHEDALRPMVSADLSSLNAAAINRALAVVGELRLADFIDDVIRVFREARRSELVESTSSDYLLRPGMFDRPSDTNAAVERRAPYVMASLNDPRAIRVLLEADSNPPLANFEIVRRLGRARPADPRLVALLRSTDPEVRWRTAYALAESADQALVPEVKRLSADPDARVREQVPGMAMQIPEPGASVVRSYVLALARDPVPKVRFEAALALGWKHDMRAAPVLHELIASGVLEDGYTSTLVQVMHTLTGSYFGYDVSQKPHAAVNREAMQRFAAWIAERTRP